MRRLRGTLIPGESLVLAAGFLAHQGLLKVDAVMAATALGAVTGDNIGYYLGRRLGRDWLLRHGRRVQHVLPEVREPRSG